jgi:outer membrane protein
MIFLVAGFAALIAGAYSSNYLFAQGGGGAPAPAAQAGTKIAVVNIGEVFNKYKRAQAFKADLEATLNPYKDKGKKLADQIKNLEDELRKPQLDPRTAAQYQDTIKAHKRTLEDMSAEIQRLLGKKQEDNLVTLWKEVNMGIDAVAKAYGFQIVLGYGDPMEKALMDQFPNVNRKMQAMDLGSTVPLYVHGSADISGIIVQTLNQWIEPKAAVQPTSGSK